MLYVLVVHKTLVKDASENSMKTAWHRRHHSRPTSVAAWTPTI